MVKGNKLKCLVLILISIPGTLNAEEKINASFQLGNYGFGLNFGPDKNNLELSLALANVFLDNPQTNIGLKIAPFNLYTDFEAAEDDEARSITYLNFFNVKLYWNCLQDDGLLLGPFLSSEYLVLRDWEKIDFKDITINAGITFGYKPDGMDYSVIGRRGKDAFYAVEMEMGYRYNTYDGHKFYFTAKTDLLYSLLFFANIGAFFSR